jgi:hypothetical protein
VEMTAALRQATQLRMGKAAGCDYACRTASADEVIE